MRNRLLWLGFGIVVAGIAALVLADVFTDMSGIRGSDIASLVWLTALLVVIGGGLAGAYRLRAGGALRDAAIWLAIIAVLVMFYTYRGTLGFH